VYENYVLSAQRSRGTPSYTRSNYLGISANGKLQRLRKNEFFEGYGLPRRSLFGTIAFSRIGNGGRVAHISLVFREMWDATDVNR
jgi:hypothetical protein